MMNLKDVKDLIEMLQGTDVVEVEVERGGVRIKVRRDGGFPHASQAPVYPVIAHALQSPAPGAGLTGVAEPAPAEAGLPENVFLVRAPLVGRFYRAPAPEAAPYVEVGDLVRKSQVLCVIEAMKLMNQIEADQGGVVRAVLVQDGQPVEFGEPLFEIENSG